MSGIALVTGGAGFIGSNLVRRLLEEGYRVRILDNFSTGRAANLEDIRDEVELIEGDLRDEKALSAAIQGVRYVFHLAALPSVIRSVHDPLSTNAVNITGTLRLLMAARDANVERVVFSSSSSTTSSLNSFFLESISASGSDSNVSVAFSSSTSSISVSLISSNSTMSSCPSS